MKQAHCVIVGARSWLAGHTGAWIIGLAVISMASGPRPAWGQSGWPGYPNNSAISVTSGGNVGIGTTAPTTTLQVQGTLTMAGGGTPGALIQTESTSTAVGILGASTYPAGASFWAYGQTHASYPGSAYIVSGGTGTSNTGLIEFANRSSSGYSAKMDILANGRVGIGTASPQYLLSVKGTVGAEEFIVTNSGWSDYVFRPGYRLRPLSEVGAYIQANHHLPDIPSEAEVKEKGVSMGEMQSKLLGKVEELTLHMIQQEKENQELRQRIARLEQYAAAGTTPAAAK